MMKRLLAGPIGLALLLSCDRPMIDTYQRCAVANLKTLTTAQADFRSNDRDGDKSENFWVRDVAGLWGLQSGGEPLRLIHRHTAKADRTPGRGAYPGHADEPPSCGYFFGALKRYGQGGKAVDYDDGKGRNPARFGLIAWPEKALRKGMPTYIVSERNEIYSKDTGGKPVEEFPEDPPAAGWTRVN